MKLSREARHGTAGKPGPNQFTLLPPIQTVAMVLTFLMFVSGSLPSTRRSAHFPFSSVPRSPAPRNSAAFFVAAGMICAGVRPAYAISSNSTCSK